jgi:hypothetical protein
MNKQLYEQLEQMASHGATSRELETEIDQRRLLSDIEREGAWLYAWALVKRQEVHSILTERRGPRRDNPRVG